MRAVRLPYRPRWPLLVILIAGVIVLIALTYVPSGGSDETGPEQGGTYVEGVAGEPARVNPLYASFNEVDRDLVSLTFSGLMRFGTNGALEPDLVEATPLTPDARTYVFQLRPGLSWQDGQPLTSSDVVFTVKTIQDPNVQGDPVLADLYRGVEVSAPDARTVIMTLPQAFAPFLARGATVGILPEHLLSGLDAEDLFDATFNLEPVGSGPFRLVELTPTAAVLEPFEAHHLGAPLLGRIELRFFRDDSELLNALTTDAVDGALFRPGLDEEDVAFIDDDSRWVRRELHGTPYSLIYLNLQSPVFADTQVRQALQHGIDREELGGAVLKGQALLLDSPIVRDMWAYEGDADAYAFDQTRAGLLLDGSGWELEGGVRVKDGAPLQFALAASDDPAQAALAQELARQWRELGIEVDVRVSGASQFVEGVLLPRDFEAALVTIDPGPDPDPYPFWDSAQAFGDGRNLSGYSNERVDTLLENARQTSSAAERAVAYDEFQEIFARDLPAVLLYTQTYQYAVRADLQGLSPGLLLSLSSRFEGVQRWHLLGASERDGED